MKMESLPTGKSSPKHLPKVSVDSEELAAPIVSEKVNVTTSNGDAWIRPWPQPLLTEKYSTTTKWLSTQKSSSKDLLKVTRGFRKADCPC